MSNILKNVDSRTKLVGQNRLEILMFRLRGRQLFAINVFKIQEVLTLPKLTLMPNRHDVIIGVIYLRGRAIPVFDLSKSIGMGPIQYDENSTIIVTEYNSSIQAFLVGAVDRILNLNWEDILPPPSGAGRSHYLTAITRVEDSIVEVIDVEKVLSEVVPSFTEVDPEILENEGEILQSAVGKELLMVDDSPTAIAQAKATFESMGVKVHTASDGAKGLQKLKDWVAEGKDLKSDFLMVVTDAEMPVMDGYMFTTEIRSNPDLKDLFVVLHTSLSGSFNEAMVEKVGCDAFLSKFKPNDLAKLTIDRLKKG